MGDETEPTGFPKWVSPSSLVTIVIAIISLIWWVSVQSGAIYQNAVALQKLEQSIFSLNTPLSTRVIVNESKLMEQARQLDAINTTNKVLADQNASLKQEVTVIREQLRFLTNRAVTNP
jgi:uncharacterized coiled-coil protein SlyX